MISVVIPTYQEEDSIEHFLTYLQENQAGYIKEIIVSDATNCSITREVVEKKQLKFVHGQKGRSIQMNNGAKAASSQILYFLHADSYPPKDFDKLIVEAVEKGHGAGCFYMGFDSKHPVLRTFGWFTRFKSSWCRGGDQSLFIEKSLFNQIGKFDEDYLILEDSEIMPRIKKATKFNVIQDKLTTSARRYRENGVFRLQFLFGIIHVGYRFGFSHNSLLAFYKKHIY